MVIGEVTVVSVPAPLRMRMPMSLPLMTLPLPRLLIVMVRSVNVPCVSMPTPSAAPDVVCVAEMVPLLLIVGPLPAPAEAAL